MRDEILAFLKRASETGDVAIDLCDTGANAGIVQSFEPGEVSNVEACADSVMGRAQSDSAGRSGKVRYELVGTKEGKRWGRQALVIDAGGGGAFGVEDANMAGIIVELVRDKREVMRMAVAHTDNIMSRMQAMLDLQNKQILATEAQRIQMFEVAESLMQHKHEREIALKSAEQDAKNNARMTESFIPLLSAAANKFVGNVTGEASPLGPEALAGLASSLDEKQIEQMASILHPPQAAAFFMLLETVAKSKEDEDKKTTIHVNGTGGTG